MMNPLIATLFFLSGLAGLIYEVAWAKHLSLFLGNTAQAHTIVLGVFMGGLAGGYYVFGKIADRAKSSLQLYGWMEIGIGLFGVLFVPLLELMGWTYIYASTRLGLDSFVAGSLKLVLSAVLLIVPTFLMGGTLPVLSRFVIRSIGEVENGIGRLYFLNSVGAVVGGLLAGFVLIPMLGLNLSITAAVALNVFVGLVALAMRPWERSRSEPLEIAFKSLELDSGRRRYSDTHVLVATVGIALSGAAALIYEIAWIRLLSLVLGSSTYSFSLMLSAFISGIALGSLFVSKRWILRFEPYVLFAVAELGIALSIILTLPIYERLPFYFAVTASLINRVPEAFWLYESLKFSVCFLLMLVPTFFLGMTLPLVSQIAARSMDKLGQHVGKVFGANTAGTLAGAVAAGLFLMPLLGLKRTIEIGVVINLLVGASALWMAPAASRRSKIWTLVPSFTLVLLSLALAPSWDQQMLSSGSFRMRRLDPATTYADFKRNQQQEILYYKDGANMTVAVNRSREGQIVLRVNGKPDASSRGDLPTQILLGQIPMLLKPESRNALVIGLGSGITAGSVLRHPIEHLDLVEISPEVVEGSRFFSPHNYDVLRDKRLDLHLEDGKTFLKITPRKYDVIVSEPSNPWIAGIGSLFSTDFYRDARARLVDGGLMVQWFHTYEMTDETLKLVLRTFAASFEHVTVWSPLLTDIIIVGSNRPFSLDLPSSLARFGEPVVKDELARLGIHFLPTVLALQVASNGGVREAAGRGRLNEDMFPVLEYEAPKAFFLGQSSNLLRSYDERRIPRRDSSLFLSGYLASRSLTVDEIKDIASYYATHGSLPGPELQHAFIDLWLRKSPEDPDARWAAARLEEQNDNPAAALKQIEYLLAREPENEKYLQAASRLTFRIYLSQRSMMNSVHPDQALSYLNRLLNLDDVKKDGVYRRIADVFAAGRDHQTAIEFLQKAAAYAERNHGEFKADVLWLEAAERALEIEKVDSALAYLERALAHNPANGAAQRKAALVRQLVDNRR